MSADLEFNKKDVDVSNNKYAVDRVAGDSTVEVKPGDTITFTRSGKDSSLGFALKFVGDKAPGPVAAQQGKTSHVETAPKTEKVLAWKYTVSFPNDESKGEDVEEYDPIIIINPGLSSSFGLMAVIFAVGAIAAYLAVRFIPGLG